MGLSMKYSTNKRADEKIAPKPNPFVTGSVAAPRDGGPAAQISSFFRNFSTGVSSFLALKPPSPPRHSFKIRNPLLTHSSLSLAIPTDSAQSDSLPLNPSNTWCAPSSEPGPEFPSGAQISTAKGGGPAFVGWIHGIYDDSGSGLVDSSSHFRIPFPLKRSPVWLKKVLAAVIKRDQNGTGSRYFMDWGDAVKYLQEHYIPKGAAVLSCDLDQAYEHFKAQPHSVQFVPNKKQVREAKKLLETGACCDGKKKLDGVPIFSSQNLDLIIETKDGIKRCTPYFFEKKVLDGILDDSADLYYKSIIAQRDALRWGDDVGKDVNHNQNNEVAKEMGKIKWDLPEVKEVVDEVSDQMGDPGTIPLSALPKLAEIEILYAVDRMFLGNRWLRKAIGIQPKFPYVVDSFERKAASFSRANKSLVEILESKQNLLETRIRMQKYYHQRSRLLPKVTIVNISTEELEQESDASVQKVSQLMKGLEQEDELGVWWTDITADERDPLFVAQFDELSSWHSSPRIVRGSS